METSVVKWYSTQVDDMRPILVQSVIHDAGRWLAFSIIVTTLVLSACSPVQPPSGNPQQTNANPTGITSTTNSLATQAETFTAQPATATLLQLTATITQTITATQTLSPSATPEPPVRFAVIGDFGLAGIGEKEVSDLVHSWNPDFVITTGDDNYPSGEAATIDQNIGQYYHDFIYPYPGIYGPGANTNRFFPSLGNHDWLTAYAQPYINYFTLPGNEYYYSFTWGPVEFFAVDSDYHDFDGITATSRQAAWLKNTLAASSSPWKIVYFHLPPFSSGSVHGSTPELQWPFTEWGATAVLSGHDHTYERIMVDGFPYFVDGLGGNGKYSFDPTPVAGSQIRYAAEYGALRVTADSRSIIFEFINGKAQVIDTFAIQK
jgi:hypothetical protein